MGSIAIIKFNLLEPVFAKQKGYPPWPALIKEFHPKKPKWAKMEFFGWFNQWYDTYEISVLIFITFVTIQKGVIIFRYIMIIIIFFRAYVSFNNLTKFAAGDSIRRQNANNIKFVKSLKEMDVWCIQKHLSGIHMTPDIFTKIQRTKEEGDNQIRENVLVVLSHHNSDHEIIDNEPNIVDKQSSHSSEKIETTKSHMRFRPERKTVDYHVGVQTRRMVKVATAEKAGELIPAKVNETIYNNVRRPKRKVTENITYAQTRSSMKKK